MERWIRQSLNRNLIIKMVIIGLLDALLASFKLSAFPWGFTINLSVAILPIYYYFERNLNPIVTSWFVASIGLIYRTLTGYYFYGSFASAFWSDFNFLFFDLIYGLVFYFIFYRRDRKTLILLFFAAIMSDFLGNTVEYLTRFGFESYFSSNVSATLFLVAGIRGIIASSLAGLYEYYQSFLRKEEHDERYRRLVNIVSDLRAEMYFLGRNSEHVESVMNEAFSLYSEYESYSAQEQKQMALNIAKNVHEIKKNYFRSIEGIEDIIVNEQSNEMINLSDMLKMLEHTFNRDSKKRNNHTLLHIKCKSQVFIREHHLLMSVLRNLISNAYEACNDSGEVTLLHDVTDEEHIFRVSDTGCGIAEDAIEYIFNPGYSTKYDRETGNSNRGIGLTLVKDIIEDYLDGSIRVESSLGQGTTFILVVPRTSIE